MNLFKSPSRRAGTVVAGAALGLVGVLSSAMPALACHPNIGKSSSCVNSDGSWVVNWTVQGSDAVFGDGKITDVTQNGLDAAYQAVPSTLDGFKVDDVLPAGKSVSGVQTLPKEAVKAVVKVTGEWETSYNNNRYGGYKNNTHKIIETRDLSESKPTELCKGQETPSPSASVPSPSASVPSPSDSTPPPSSSTPPPSDSTPPPSSSTPPSEPTLTEPQLVYDTTCDTLTVGVEVPADNKDAITVTFTPNKGDAKTVTAKPGETKTVDFDAFDGLKVTASAKGQEDTTIAYKAPKDCGELALTGSNSSTIAGGAALVLIVGAGLFYMARRRKIRFTA